MATGYLNILFKLLVSDLQDVLTFAFACVIVLNDTKNAQHTIFYSYYHPNECSVLFDALDECVFWNLYYIYLYS